MSPRRVTAQKRNRHGAELARLLASAPRALAGDAVADDDERGGGEGGGPTAASAAAGGVRAPLLRSLDLNGVAADGDDGRRSSVVLAEALQFVDVRSRRVVVAVFFACTATSCHAVGRRARARTCGRNDRSLASVHGPHLQAAQSQWHRHTRTHTRAHTRARPQIISTSSAAGAALQSRRGGLAAGRPTARRPDGVAAAACAA